MKNLFDEEVNPPMELTPDYQMGEWLNEFRKWLELEYEKHSSNCGRLCCGCDWMCDDCKCEYGEGTKDCMITILAIAKELGIEIDYYDFDFEKLEKKIKQKYDER